MGYGTLIKPMLDGFTAVCCLLLFAPIFSILSIVLLISNQGKVFFTQQRTSKDGRLFRIYKFRSMTDKRDANGNLLPDKERLTNVGKFIRRTSLDELPQLFNVLKGDMSFVGPRPLLPEYLKLYSQHQNRRHEVNGGITGWAQVNGRNAITWEEKFNFDVWYVEHQSFSLDLKILFLTIKKVIVREGINTQGQVTTEPFKG